MSDVAFVPARAARSRNLTTFLAALALSKAGDAIYLLALPWIAYELTQSAMIMSLLYGLEFIPIVLFGAMAGVLVDGYGLRRSMLVSDAARFALVAAIPLLHASEGLQPIHLAVIAFALGLLTLVFDVATVAAIPRLVDAEITRANAAHQSILQLSLFAGPLLAGILIQRVGAFQALAIDAATFAATFLVVSRQPLLASASAAARRDFRAELREGLRWFWSHRAIRTLALQAAVGNFGFAMVSGLLLFYLRDTLSASATSAGLVLAMAGVGGITGSIATVPLVARMRPGALYPWILTAGFLGYVTMAVVPSWSGAAAGMAIVSACNMAWVTLSTTVRQQRIPPPLLGRVLALSRVLSVAAVPAGAAVGGWIASRSAFVYLFAIAAGTKLIELAIATRSEIKDL